MMEFKVNRADPEVPAKHSPHAPEGGLMTDPPALAHSSGRLVLLLFPETPDLPHLAEEQTVTQTQPEHPGSWKPHCCLWRREERISSNIQSLSGKLEGQAVVVFFCCCGLFY